MPAAPEAKGSLVEEVRPFLPVSGSEWLKTSSPDLTVWPGLAGGGNFLRGVSFLAGCRTQGRRYTQRHPWGAILQQEHTKRRNHNGQTLW